MSGSTASTKGFLARSAFGILGLVAIMVALVFGSASSAFAVEESGGTVVSWGNNGSGQSTVPEGLSNVKAISAGHSHSLALKEDGMVVAWGSNAQGQSTVPEGLSNVKAISAGDYHSLALKEDGAVVAWGNNGSGQSTVPVGLSKVKAFSAGGFHSLAIRDILPPKVQGVMPLEGATDVGPATNVRAFFSEPMRARSIKATTFKLFEAATNTRISAAVSYEAATRKAVIDPEADLVRGVRYKAVVTSGAKDLSGNALDQNQDPSDGNQKKVWSFTVR